MFWAIFSQIYGHPGGGLLMEKNLWPVELAIATTSSIFETRFENHVGNCWKQT
jgi:hypothetical protein